METSILHHHIHHISTIHYFTIHQIFQGNFSNFPFIHHSFTIHSPNFLLNFHHFPFIHHSFTIFPPFFFQGNFPMFPRPLRPFNGPLRRWATTTRTPRPGERLVRAAGLDAAGPLRGTPRRRGGGKDHRWDWEIRCGILFFYTYIYMIIYIYM